MLKLDFVEVALTVKRTLAIALIKRFELGMVFKQAHKFWAAQGHKAVDKSAFEQLALGGDDAIDYIAHFGGVGGEFAVVFFAP